MKRMYQAGTVSIFIFWKGAPVLASGNDFLLIMLGQASPLVSLHKHKVEVKV